MLTLYFWLTRISWSSLRDVWSLCSIHQKQMKWAKNSKEIGSAKNSVNFQQSLTSHSTSSYAIDNRHTTCNLHLRQFITHLIVLSLWISNSSSCMTLTQLTHNRLLVSIKNRALLNSQKKSSKCYFIISYIEKKLKNCTQLSNINLLTCCSCCRRLSNTNVPCNMVRMYNRWITWKHFCAHKNATMQLWKNVSTMMRYSKVVTF